MEEGVVLDSSSINNLSEYFENSCDGFFLINENMELCCANETMQGWIGITATATQRVNLHDVISLGDSKDMFLQNCGKALKGVPTRFESLIRPANKAPRWLEISLQRTPDSKLLGIARDIGHHKQEIDRLHFRSSQDVLTGLLNRNEFMRILQDMDAPIAGSDQSLFIVELEHFNVINDMCGLAAGDELLCQVADIIRSSLSKHDIAARIGGKKFAVLSKDCNIMMALSKATEIRDNINASKFECDNKKYEIGVGIGYTLLQNDTATNRYSAMSEADSACHYARNMGHNQIHAYSLTGNNSYRQQEAEWISRIASAFEHGRFQLFYQNIIQIESGSEVDDHHEILLRMRDENGRHITPNEFIPAAEKYNLMHLIDRWVIRTLFTRNAALWRDAFSIKKIGAEFPMSLCCVNISGASLNDDYFSEFLRDQIAFHKVPPQAVCFEITETVAVNDLEKASLLIKELRAEGFRFALDDFGKGMSSFSYLQALQVDFLKIDGSLVQNIDTNKSDLCMVEAINKIAQDMGIKTIAEYVKNQKVIDMLQVVGVDYVQGFGIHQPEPLL